MTTSANRLVHQRDKKRSAGLAQLLRACSDWCHHGAPRRSSFISSRGAAVNNVDTVHDETQAWAAHACTANGFGGF